MWSPAPPMFGGVAVDTRKHAAAKSNVGVDGFCVVLDVKGFIKTGPDISQEDLAAAAWPLTRPPYLLETSRRSEAEPR